jgi:predicted XRE-type DNA-binding protein
VTDEELPDDPATAALDRLVDIADSNATELRSLERDLRAIQAERRRGRSWQQILSASAVPQVLARLSRVAADLATAGGSFRRGIARALRSEGMMVNEIAGLFGVSRQRVSTLVRSDASSSEADS